MSGDWRLWPQVRPKGGKWRIPPKGGKWRVPPKGGKWRPTGHSSETAKKCAGYNIVILAVAITVLNILVAKALPLWSHVIQREKEEELIFRGLQYAEAIRIVD